MANVIHGDPRNPNAAMKLTVERIRAGLYRYYYNGRMVEVMGSKYEDKDDNSYEGVSWFTILNGTEYDKDFATKREAVAEAKRWLGCSV